MTSKEALPSSPPPFPRAKVAAAAAAPSSGDDKPVASATRAKSAAKKDKGTSLKSNPKAKNDATNGTNTAGSSPTTLTPEGRILLALLYAREYSKNNEPSCDSISTWSGFNNKASFKAICGRLIQRGLIEYPADSTAPRIKLTEAGLTQVEGPEMTILPKKDKALHSKIKKEMILRKKCRKIFDLLADGGDHAIADCAKLIGYEEHDKRFRIYFAHLYQWTETYRNDRGIKMVRLRDSVFILAPR